LRSASRPSDIPGATLRAGPVPETSLSTATNTPWLPLLHRLTETAPTWGIWKRPDSALEGDGDIDSVASTGDWPSILREYRAWASEHSLEPVVLCTHIPGALVLAACSGEAPTRLLQLDVYARHVFRGATLIQAGELQPFMELDPRGFRRLRPGAEALLVLLHRGIRRGGRPGDPGTRSGIVDLLQRDPEGAEQLASAIGLPVPVVRAVRDGDWEGSSLLIFELRTALRLLRDPRELGRCMAVDYRRFRGCSLSDALSAGRRVPGNRAEWLREIRRSHTVYET